MFRLLIFVAAASLMATPATFARSDSRILGGADCALESQLVIARRYGLRAASDSDLSLKIYANPKLAQEADDAFDGCVRRRSQP